MPYCPYCGADVELDSKFCLKCGKKLPEGKFPEKEVPSWKPSSPEPSYRPESRPIITSSPFYQPKPYHPALKAPLGERCVAALLDDAVGAFIPVFGWVYSMIKDGIRDGQSLGKGLMGLRVIDFQTGMPATMGQSFMRNCFPGCCDACCCYLTLIMDRDGRRIGDQVAGTVVILDK